MEHVIFRFVSSFLSGMILSQTGSLLQMSSRNILASPSTLGFDGLSVLWVLIFHTFLVMTGQEAALGLLFFSGVPVFLLIGWLYSRFIGPKKEIEKLIFIGLTFNLLVGAVFSLWQFLFLAFNLPFPVELWFGHFRYADVMSSSLLLGFEMIFLIGWLGLKKDLYAFSLGKSLSRNLNLQTRKLYVFQFSVIALGTFMVIAFFGAFSFLGLIFPILSRKVWFRKFDLKGEVFMGAMMNGAILMGIDSLCYYFPVYGAEVPVGLLATAIGAVSLIFLLWKSRSQVEILAKT